MRAVSIEGPGQVVLIDAPDPKPGPEDVVVRVAAVGLCGTDLHLFDGDLSSPAGLIPGHEFGGEVVELGAAVDGFRVGDRVAIDPNLPCGTCRWCRAGRGNICRSWDAIGVSRSDRKSVV